MGAVRSIATGRLGSAVTLPARSEMASLVVRALPSPVIVSSVGHEPAIPDRPSEQPQWTLTSPLYQPSALGVVVGVPVRMGDVSSTLMPLIVTELVFPALSTAVPVTA